MFSLGASYQISLDMEEEFLESVKIKPAISMERLSSKGAIPVWFEAIVKDSSNFDPITLAINLTTSLKLLHAKGLRHGDLNSRNILVCPVTHKVWIIDFGSSSFHHNAANGGVTDYYGPPEMIVSGRWLDYKKNINEFLSADVWSLGMLLFFLFTKLEFVRHFEKFASRLLELTAFKQRDRLKTIYENMTPTPQEMISMFVEETRPFGHAQEKEKKLVMGMLNTDPKKRPSINVVLNQLKNFQINLDDLEIKSTKCSSAVDISMDKTAAPIES